MARVHGVTPSTPVGAADAEQIARVMSALSTGSRVRILAHLRQGTCSVGDLTTAVEMAQPAVSHQLRILRDLGLVVSSRRGRNTVYGLHDAHVRSLLDEALRHLDHLRAGHEDEGPTSTSKVNRTARRVMTEQHSHEEEHVHEDEHAHGDESHDHAHTTHDHEHVEHTHEHSHDGDTHEHPHVHEAGLEQEHAHSHD